MTHFHSPVSAPKEQSSVLSISQFQHNPILMKISQIKPVFHHWRLLLATLCLFLISSTLVNAQQFQLVLDPVNPYQKTSLFNLSLINPNAYVGSVQLQATLKTRRGKTLLVQSLSTNLSGNVSLSIRGTTVEATTTFIDADFDRLYTSSTQLPPMNYVLCIEAHAIGDLSSKVQECVDYQASDLINISPIYPPNSETIYDARPQFTWINLDANNPCAYNFRLVEVAEGQNENVAIRRNNPLVAIDALNQNQLLYPADALPLKNKQAYAWQLGLVCQGEEVSKTDAFSFTYKESEEYIDIPRDLSYVDITEIEGGSQLFAVGEFKFKYPSDWQTTLTAELYEIKTKKKKQLELEEDSFSVQLGLNKFELDLKEQVYLKHLKTYELLLQDEKTQRTYQFMIQYVNPDYIK